MMQSDGENEGIEERENKEEIEKTRVSELSQGLQHENCKPLS